MRQIVPRTRSVILRAVVGLLALAGVLVDAPAQSAQLAQGFQLIVGSSGANPCVGQILQVNLASGSSCVAGASYASAFSIPGLTFTPGTLSGTGATTSFALTAAGTLQPFASGAQRCTTAGCVAEGAGETNLIFHSQDSFSTSGGYWGCFHATGTPNAGTAPDSTSTAAIFSLTASDGSCSNNNGGGVAQVALQQYSDSVYVGNTGSLPDINFRAFDGTNAAGANCVFATQVCTLNIQTYSSVSVDQLQRLGTTNNYRVCIHYTAPATTGLSTKDGIFGSGESSGNETVWGFQHQTGPVCGGYLPTTTAAVTLSPDVFTVPCASCTSDFGAVYFNGQNGYFAPTSTIDLAAAGTPWYGQPIQQVLVSASQPVPLQALNAGLTQVTFSTPAFSTSNMDTACTRTTGWQWQNFTFFGFPCSYQAPVTFPSSGVAAISGTNLASSGYATAGANSAGTNWFGTAFGASTTGGAYGLYVEFQVSFNDAAETNPGTTGWPAIWSMALEHLSNLTTQQWPGQPNGTTNYIEADLGEYDWSAARQPFFASLHHWYGTGTCVASPPSNCNYAKGSIANFLPANFNVMHRYGLLWTPATSTTQGSFQYFLDGVQVSGLVQYSKFVTQTTPAAAAWTTASTQITMSAPNSGNITAGMTVYDSTTSQPIGVVSAYIGTTLTLNTNAANASSGASDSILFSETPPPGPSAPWSFGVIDTNHLVFIISSGSSTPINAASFTVWQKDASGDLHQVVPILPFFARRRRKAANDNDPQRLAA